MENEKDFNFSEYQKFFNNNSNEFNDFNNWFLLMIIIMLFWGTGNETKSYLQGKIEAYENVLKGFENNER